MNNLDLSRAHEIAEEVVNNLEYDGGYSVEEMIPGLVQAIIDIADGNDNLLDAAANLLADGGVIEEQEQ